LEVTLRVVRLREKKRTTLISSLNMKIVKQKMGKVQLLDQCAHIGFISDTAGALRLLQSKIP